MQRELGKDIEAGTNRIDFLESNCDKVEEKGSMKMSYGQVVNSNLPEAFTINIPIFKGVAPASVQVEVYATIDGSEVYLQLFSPAANQIIEEMRDATIDDQIAKIRELSPDIAIIEQ